MTASNETVANDHIIRSLSHIIWRYSAKHVKYIADHLLCAFRFKDEQLRTTLVSMSLYSYTRQLKLSTLALPHQQKDPTEDEILRYAGNLH